MEPLLVTAHLAGAVCLPDGFLALDALLGAAVCMRDNVPPAYAPADVVPLDIPLALSECRRYYLASFAQFEREAHELRYITKRAPIEQYKAHGDAAIKTVLITAGANKSYRIPMETIHLEHDMIGWFCVGDRARVESLLALIHYVGKKRAAGLGKVERWTVEPCEAWGDDFPVALNGQALRTLPDDFAALTDPDLGYANTKPPYWMRETESLCALPRRS